MRVDATRGWAMGDKKPPHQSMQRLGDGSEVGSRTVFLAISRMGRLKAAIQRGFASSKSALYVNRGICQEARGPSRYN